MLVDVLNQCFDHDLQYTRKPWEVIRNLMRIPATNLYVPSNIQMFQCELLCTDVHSIAIRSEYVSCHISHNNTPCYGGLLYPLVNVKDLLLYTLAYSYYIIKPRAYDVVIRARLVLLLYILYTDVG